MAFLQKDGENNEENDLYEKSGDEDDRLRKEYLYFSFSTHGRADLCVERLSGFEPGPKDVFRALL